MDRIKLDTEAIATNMYEQGKDIDFMDYEDTRADVIEKLEQDLYDLNNVCGYDTLKAVLKALFESEV